MSTKKQKKNQTPMKLTPGRLLALQAGATTVDGLKNHKNFVQTEDSFSNFVARLGIQNPDGNLISSSYYELGPFISRNRLELEAMYRSSWIVGQVVDTVAEDMTREGVTMNSELDPDKIDQFQVALSQFGIWHDICLAIKWARLYGGCIAVLLIDGADYSKPLDIERIKKDQFKGLVVLDRWMIQPMMGDLITDICKDIGKPKFYEVLSGVSTFPSQKLHHTRVMRFDGIELPYYQKLFENMWGISVVERMFDRLVAFDSATTGAAQLLYKAHLRVMQIEGFREALAAGGADESAVLKQFEYIRTLQSNEGITALDSKDVFSTHSYSFSGVSDMLQQFGQQISGATNIPLVRLFGQSPAGFSTGETDLKNYYDLIKKEQESDLRSQLDKLFGVMGKSLFGEALPEDFSYTFNSLWHLSESEKSQISTQDTNTVASAFGGGLIGKAASLKELKQQSHVTGRFTNITAEDIEAAEEEDKAPDFDMGGFGGGEPSGPQPAEEENETLGGQNPDLANEKGEEAAIENKSEKPVKDSAKKMKFKDRLKLFMDSFKVA